MDTRVALDRAAARGRLGASRALLLGAVAAVCAGATWAQLRDITQAPNAAGAGISKSLAEQIGLGRGDLLTPGSSRFLIARDGFRAIRRGRQLFQRKFTLAQGLGPTTSDGVGEIGTDQSIGAGLADSCASCHGRPRGSAGVGGNVFTRPASRDAPHLFGLGLVEMLADEITTDLRRTRNRVRWRAARTGRTATLPLRSKGISFGTVTATPDGSVDLSKVVGVDADLRVKPFFAQGASFSIREFTVGALNAEMGLEPFDPDLQAAATGGRVVTPSGLVLDGSLDKVEPPAARPGEDNDEDGHVDELDVAVVDYLEFYLLNYFKPALHRQSELTARGFGLMAQIGCTTCHVRDLTVERDRRLADVETVYDPEGNGLNELFATAAGRFRTEAGGNGQPPLLVPSHERFVVRNLFADFRRHDLGPAFHERNFDGTYQRQHMTEPLWGVGSTAPYGHDGRSMTLHDVIVRHGGEALEARDRYVALGEAEKQALVGALSSLVLFPPDDTASNLAPPDLTHPDYPHAGLGRIALSGLFLDPADPE